MMSEERMRILELIQEGKITAEEGVRLLEALRPAAGGQATGEAPDEPARGERGRRHDDPFGSIASAVADAIQSGSWSGSWAEGPFRHRWGGSWSMGKGGGGQERRRQRQAEGWQFLSLSEGDRGTFDLPEGARLEIESEASAVEAAATDGPVRVELHGDDPHDFAVYAARKGEDVVLSAYRTARRGRMPRLVVRVPRHVTSVRLTTSGGGLHAQGFTGPLILRTAGGGVHVGAHGEGDLDARTAGGGIHVQGTPGRASLHTAGGGIHFTGRTNALDAKTAGGSIHIDGVRLTSGDHRAETAGGSIHVKLAPDSSVEIDARTTAGHIGIDLPGAQGEYRRTSVVSREYRGRFNGSGAHLQLSTTGGSITVGLAAAAPAGGSAAA